MKRRNDYKVAMAESMELEPLGGMDKSSDTKRNGINKYGGDSTSGRPGREGVAVCSQKRALCVTAIVLGTLLATALVIAYAGPQSVCPCAGKIPPGFVVEGYNSSEPFQPIATNGQPFPWLLPTLPNNVRPNRYMLTIHPNLTTLDVKGQVTVEFYVEKETNFIVLHAQDLNITEKALVGPKGYALKILRILEYPPRQQLYIELRDKLRKKTNFTLSIRWYSKMITEPDGFFVDVFEPEPDVKRILAATVLKPGSARKAFPCFDEPHLRASFRISLFRDRFHIGLSNSIVQDTDDVGFYMGTGLLRDDFAETPPLSPNMISWVISSFKRQLLDPSPIYQTVNITKDTHKPLLEPTRPPPKLTKAEKKPFRNLTAVLLSKNLFKLTNNQPPSTVKPSTANESSSDGAVTAQAVQGNHTNGNGTESNHTIASDALEIKTAPAYSFYAPQPYVDKGSFVLYTSRDILEYLQQWLGVAYPLSKLDFIVLPTLHDDFTSSLGLIVFRMSFLNSPEEVSTKDYHMSVVKISEGIIKQYFGGLISPKTWKHVWLWEGIIKYLSRFILTPIRPLWPMNELFLIETTTRALDIDALQGWESISHGTSDTGDNEDFYIDKSATMLSMLQSAIGEANFRHCLGKFIKAFKFMTAEPTDLWSICARQVNSSKNVKEMMNYWTNLPGFPLVNVSREGDELHISQVPFAPAEFVAIHDDPNAEENDSLSTTTTTTTTVAPPTAKDSKRRTRWTFPVSYVTSNSDQLPKTIWFNSTETKITLDHSPKWIKLNHDQTGYYRVLYDEDNWSKLVEQLQINHHIFNTQDRVGIVSDIFTLCHANLLRCDYAMDLISYFPKEQDWGPVLVGLKHLEKWRKILKYSECYLVLAEYIRQNLAKSIQDLTWNDTGKEELKLLRPTVLLSAVLWEEPDAIRNAKELMNDQANIPPNLRPVAYVGSVLSGEIRYWQDCWALYNALRREKDVGSEERMELLRALGVTRDAWLQNRLLSHVITLPVTEIVQVLQAIAGTPTGGAMACRFLQAKWLDFQSKLGKGSVDFARVISAITQYGSTKFDYDELKSLVERFGDGPGMKILNMTLSMVAANVEWVSRSQSSIYSWIESKYQLKK
ncbi:endoplasmic reticulum aminopeptidase 2 isoform X1 [Aedes albopictus]|uniref:Aminopeptidase n=1 Tax=Aedes albopictus TaxID=7160 RepID=A0ABM1ZYQ9_AEDAL